MNSKMVTFFMGLFLYTANAFSFFGTLQEPPANLKASWTLHMEIKCEEGKLLEFSHGFDPGVNLKLENPTIESANQDSPINLLSFIDSNDERPNFMKLNEDGSIGVRGKVKDDFFVIGHLKAGDIEGGCAPSKEVEIKKWCIGAGWALQDIPRCLEIRKEVWNSFFHPVEIAFNMDSDVNLKINRTEPYCSYRFADGNHRTATYKIMLSKSNAEVNLSLNKITGYRFKDLFECGQIQDGWK